MCLLRPWESLWETSSTEGTDGVHLAQKRKSILPGWWRGLLKSGCETRISINLSPTSLERVVRSLVELLKSSTGPFHYLHLLQFIMSEHHGVFSFLFCPWLSQYWNRMFMESSRGHWSRWGQACSPLILVHSSQLYFLCFALCCESSCRQGREDCL